MPCEKTDRVQAHQEVQDWIQNSAGVIGGSQIGGFAGDQEEPEAGGDPGLQYLLLRGVHAGVPTSGAWREPAPLKTKEPQTARRSTKGGELELFDGIVWSLDRKSTRLNSSHRCISYAVFCLKKKKQNKTYD